MEKWFDLGSRGQVRFRREGAVQMLRLELSRPPSVDQLRRAREVGWTLPDSASTTVLDHYTKFKSTSEIAQALMAFFKPDVVREAYKQISSGPVEVKAPTVDGPHAPSPAEILQHFAENAPPAFRERVQQTILAAQAATGARMAAAAELPLKGDGLGVLARLSDRIGPVEAGMWFGHVLRSVGRDPEWARLSDAIVEASHGGPLNTPSISSEMQERVEWAVKHHRLSENAHGGAAPLEDFIRAAVCRRQKITYRALDGAHVKASGEGSLGQHSFRAQPGISPTMARDAAYRTELAIAAVAKVLGRSRDRVFGDNSLQFIVGPSVGAGEGISGLARTARATSGAEAVEAHAIQMKPSGVGVLIHEIGHQVHSAAGAEAFRREIEQHAFYRESTKLIDLLEAHLPLSAAYADYLRQPDEVFARAFDAHVASEVRGDGGFAAAGGSLATIADPSNTAGPAAIQEFMTDMAPVLRSMTEDRRRSAAPRTPAPMSLTA